MVVCDAVRAVLVAAMARPRMPLASLVALLFATMMFAPPFDSARAAITADILQGERYVLGTSVTQTTFLAARCSARSAAGWLWPSSGFARHWPWTPAPSCSPAC